MQDQDRDTLALARETAMFAARRIVTGRVRVRTETASFEDRATGELAGTTVEVERVAMNVHVDVAPPIRPRAISPSSRSSRRCSSSRRACS